MFRGNLFDIVRYAANPPTKTDLELLRHYLHENPYAIYLTDWQDKTPFHYAINNFELLTVLALEGNASLPEDLTDDADLKPRIKELEKEQIRNRKFHGFHLHDLIRRSVPENLIKNRYRYHRNEINETTFWQRNACHWAALMNKPKYIEAFFQLGGDLNALDLDGKSPFDLATTEETKTKIRELLARPKNSKDELANDEMKNTSPRSYSPRNPQLHERHSRAISPPLSPRNKEQTPVVNLKSILKSDIETNDSPSPEQQRHTATALTALNITPPTGVAVIANKKTEKHTRFIDDAVQKTKLDEVDANPMVEPIAPKLPEHSAFFKSLEECVIIIKNDDLDKFQELYKNRKFGPNRKLSGFGRPFIVQAFLSNAGRIFIFLLNEGANLDLRTDKGKSFIDYIFEDNTVERIAFLKHVRENLSFGVNNRKQAIAQERLSKLENTILSKSKIIITPAYEKGKQKELDDNELAVIATNNKQSPLLVKALYNLCLGAIDAKQSNHFDPHAIQKIIIGLLIKNPPQVMFSIIKDLVPHLQEEQKFVGLFIIKEMIARDRFHFCYRDKAFVEEITRLFQQTALETELQELLTLQHELNDPLLRGTYQLDMILAKCDGSTPPLLITNHLELANELRAITQRFYRTFHLSEFAGKAWEKENKLETSPNVVNQTNIFNKISEFFVTEILTRRSEKERLAYIKLCVKTLNELINGNPCDLQSAMAVSAALENKYISKHLKTFLRRDSNTADMWEKAQKTLDFAGNYPGQRKIIADDNRTTFPFLGIFTKDLTFGSENTDIISRAEIEGKVFLQLMKAQEQARAQPLIPTTSHLSSKLYKQAALTDEEMELLVMRADPKPIRIDALMTLSLLRKLIDIYVEQKLELAVKQETDKVGIKAINAIFSWIEENILSKNITELADVDKLIRKMEALPNAKGTVEFRDRQFKMWLKCQAALGKIALSNQDDIILQREESRICLRPGRSK